VGLVVASEPTKLIVHLGFPKTGSSTLQHGLFADLEERGLLSYTTWRKHSADEPLTERPSSRLFQGRSIPSRYLSFGNGSLGILSDESFTAPTALRAINFGPLIRHPSTFPDEIVRQAQVALGKQCEMWALVVVRNQVDLIYSQYVEEYNLKTYKDIDLIFNESGNAKVEGFDVYRFDEYHALCEQAFGSERTVFLFYEELRDDPRTFSQRLASLLGVQPSVVADSLTSTFLNKKTRTAQGYLTKQAGISVPFFPDNVKREIRDFFREGNERLAKRLDAYHTMSRWGYLT